MKRLATMWLVPLLAALLPVSLAFGQQTTASMTGTVVDENGDPLPGANVVAVHEPTGTQYGTAANENGRYTILNMRVGGPYTVEASFVGYESEQESDLTLQLGQRRTLNLRLESAAAELEEVEIVGQRRGAVISSDRTGASRNISAEEIEQLPTINRSLTDFTRLVPQSGGGNNLAGRNARYNKIQIDGATLDDVFGLGEAVPGSQAGAQPISLDAIQEFNVDIAPYDVRSSGFTGGQINAITKSGTNEFEGSVRYLGRNQNFTGTLDGTELGDFQEQYFVGTLGGPIVEDELFFFVSGELRRQSSPLDARIGDVQGPNTFQISQNLLSEAGYSSTEALLSDVQNIAQSQYAYEPGGIDPFTQDEDNEKFLAKLDWNISPDHRLTVRHNYVNARDDSGINRGRNSFAFSNRQYIFRSRQNSSTVQLNSTLGDNMFNEARIVYTRIRDERDVQDREFPETELQFGDQSVIMGIDRFSQANRLDQDLYEITNNLTWARGDHTITFGTNNEIFSFANLFIQDVYGQYQFRPFTYENETGETVEVSAVEAFRRGQPSTYRLSYSLLDELRPEAEFTGLQLGFYVQDEWQATSNLRLTGGLRADIPLLPQEPRNNPAAQEAFGRSTTNVASGNLLWSPRLGFNYADEFLDDALETQVRGGTGVFSGRPPFVWISNQYSNTGADFARLDVDFNPGEDFVDANGNYDPSVSCYAGAGDPAAQPRPGDCPGLEPIETTEINLIEDDFRYPQTWRSNLAVDQELPLGFIATLEGLYSKSINEIVYENINLEQTGTSAHGRPLYGTARTFGSTRNIVDERFTNALLLKNTNEGYEYSLTAQLQRRVPTGLNGSIAYTYNRAKNVNNGTSSRAISNWQFNENVDVNDAGLGTADFERRHRFLANLTYRFAYADRFATSIGVIYEGLSGAPFSWIYFGDANADGESFNDLVYVPASEDEIVLESDNWAALNAFIESEPSLNEVRGGFAERNSARDPWQSLLDLRVNQEVATFQGQRFEITAVVENALNLLNDDWGRVQFSEFNNNNAWEFIGYDDNGRPIISFDEQTAEDRETGDFLQTANVASRWRLQLGVRYTF